MKKINEFYVRTERRFSQRHGQLYEQVEALVYWNLLFLMIVFREKQVVQEKKNY